MSNSWYSTLVWQTSSVANGTRAITSAHVRGSFVIMELSQFRSTYVSLSCRLSELLNSCSFEASSYRDLGSFAAEPSTIAALGFWSDTLAHLKAMIDSSKTAAGTLSRLSSCVVLMIIMSSASAFNSIWS